MPKLEALSLYLAAPCVLFYSLDMYGLYCSFKCPPSILSCSLSSAPVCMAKCLSECFAAHTKYRHTLQSRLYMAHVYSRSLQPCLLTTFPRSSKVEEDPCCKQCAHNSHLRHLASAIDPSNYVHYHACTYTPVYVYTFYDVCMTVVVTLLSMFSRAWHAERRPGEPNQVWRRWLSRHQFPPVSD